MRDLDDSCDGAPAVGVSTPPPVAKSVLDLFWKLREEKDNSRIEAAARLVAQLKPTTGKAEGAVGVNRDSERELSYCLQRLVRGLAAERAASRLGFYVALVEVLRQGRDGARFKDVHRLAQQHLNVQGSKSEVANHLYGQVLCYGAVLRSGAAAPGDEAAQAVDKLLECAGKRNYLSLPAYTFVVDYVQTCDDAAALKDEIVPVLARRINFDEMTLESAWALLVLKNKGLLRSDFVKANFGRKKLLTKDFSGAVAAAMFRQPTWVVRAHPCLPVLVAALADEGVVEFWADHVEPVLAIQQSRHKSSVAFHFLRLAVDGLADKSKAEAFLTAAAVKAAVAVLTKAESAAAVLTKAESAAAAGARDDEKAILGALNSVVAACDARPTLQQAALKRLLTNPPGNIAFDKISGSTVVHRITQACSAESVRVLAQLYGEAVTGHTGSIGGGGGDGKSRLTTQERLYAAHQLAKLIGHPAMAEHSAWKSEQINLLMVCALFDLKRPSPLPLPSSPPPPLPFSREAKHDMKDVFFRALDSKARNVDVLCSILRKVMAKASSLLSSSSRVVGAAEPPSFPLDEASLAAWNDAAAAVDQIAAADDDDGDDAKKEQRVFQILFIHMAFQLFAQPSVARETLSELHACRAKAGQGRRSGAGDDGGGDGEPAWVEVVVELLLSLLAQNKNVYRQVVNAVFAQLCAHMTLQGLQTVMDVVVAKEGRADGSGGREDDDDEMDGEEDEATDDDDADDAEEMKTDDDSESEENDVDESTRQKLERTLDEFSGAAAAAADDDDDDVDMDALDDHSMARLDAALANVFRQMSGGRKSEGEKKRDRRDALARMHFRIRALDIVDVYLSHQPRMSHALFLLQPLLTTLETVMKRKEMKPLETRLVATLKKLAWLKKLSVERDDLDGDELKGLLQALVDKANSGAQVVALLSNPKPVFAQLCMLVVRCGERSGLSEEVFQIYNKSVDDFFHNGKCLLPLAFFLLPIHSRWSGSWRLAEKVASAAFEGGAQSRNVRQFRRTQAVAMLTALVRSNQEEADESEARRARANVLDGIFSGLLSELDSVVSAAAASDVGGGASAAKPRHVCELLDLLHALKATGAAEGQQQAGDCERRKLGWDSAQSLLTRFRAHVPAGRNFHDVKRHFNKIATLLAVKVVQGSAKKRNRGGGVGGRTISGSSDGGGGDDAEVQIAAAHQVPKQTMEAIPAHTPLPPAEPPAGANLPTPAADEVRANGREAGREETGEKGSKKKKQKKNKSKESQQEKKERKKFEIEGQFVGQEMPTFSGIAINTSMNFVGKSEADLEKAKANTLETAEGKQLKRKNHSKSGAHKNEKKQKQIHD